MNPPKTCDNQVVGVIPIRADGHWALFDRGTFPEGKAPVAGHLDGDDPDVAARKEVAEELGLSVVELTLEITTSLGNHCRRQGGTHHNWWVYTAKVTGDLDGEHNQREALRPQWHHPSQMHALAQRTVEYARGRLPREDWLASFGLEPVWVILLHHLREIRLDADDFDCVEDLAAQAVAP